MQQHNRPKIQVHISRQRPNKKLVRILFFNKPKPYKVMFLKFTWKLPPQKRRYLIKTLLIMKFIAIFLFAAGLQVSATGYSQTITLAQNNVSLKKVFREIEKQSGYQFFYKDRLIRQTGNVSINVHNATVETVLNECFKNQPLSYTVLDKIIVVKAKKHIELISPVAVLPAPAMIIHGTVKDEKGNPLAAVSVIVKGTTKGTSTATDGSFSIDANIGDVLEFTIVGYQKRSVTIGKDLNITIVMEIEASVGGEVVVVAYGQTTKRKITSAVSTLDMKDVAPLPVQSINDGIAGRVQGVIVTSSTGAPGAKSQISIRGGGTPLFVIDNLIRSQNDFENLNPNDIETFSVLKDAAATSIYGALGGNGVVLVTTKKGKAGQVNINYSYNQIFSQPTVFPKKLDSYEKLNAINKVYLAEGRQQPTPDSILNYYKNQSQPFVYPNTDWQKVALKSFAPETRNDLSISSGTRQLTYYASGSYYHQGSNLRTDNNYNNRITYRLNTVSNFDNIKLKVTTGLDGFVENNDVPNSSTASSYYALYSHIQNQSPTNLAYNNLGLPSANTTDNPAVELSPLSGYSKNTSRVFNSILAFDWEAPFVTGLHLKLTGNYNMWNSMSKSWNATAPSYANNSTTAIFGNPPSLTAGRGDGSTLTLQGFVTYTKSFGDNNIDFTGGYEQAQDKSESLSATRQQYQILFDQFIAGPTVNQLANGSEYQTARSAYIGRLNYNFKSKYFLDGTVRYDGNAAFPKGKQWGIFPAISAGWILSEENFMQFLKQKNILDYLKLRGSYGLVGVLGGSAVDANNTNLYAYVPGYTINANTWVIAGQPVQGTSEPGTLPSTNFSWYSIRSRNIGLDLATLNNRLSASIDYFYMRTTGYVGSDTRYAATLGIGLPPINNPQDALRREGAEFNVTWNDRVGDFTYKVGVNFTYFNQLWEYYPGEDTASIKNPYTRTSGTTGSALQQGYINDGFYSQNSDLLNGPRRISSVNVVGGDLKYEDTNGDGKIDGSDFRRIGSNTFPRSNYGVTFDLGYKGIYLNAVVMGTGNRDRYLGDVIQGSSAQGILIYKFQEDYWTPSNTNALYPRQVSSAGVNGNNNYTSSNFWLLKSSFVRLKFLQIGYDLKTKVLKNTAFKQCKVFVSGTNLLTSSKSMKYFIDPESDPNNYNYPIQRTFAVGANIGF